MKRFFIVSSLIIIICFDAPANNDKPIVTVLDFSTNGVSGQEMKGVISLISSALFQSQKFTVIDVSEREKLLQEMEFSVSSCTDETCQLQLGRMLSAESIILGQINKIGTRYLLSIKMLETETARTQGTADGIYQNLDQLLDDVNHLVLKLTTAVNQSPAAATDKPNVPEQRLFYSVTAGVGPAFPVGKAGEIFSLGLPVNLAFGLNQPLGWGEVSLLADLGFILQPTLNAIRYPYSLYMFPVALGAGYKTNFMLPFYLAARLAGGMIFYRCIYAGEYPDRKDSFYMDFYTSFSLGAGWRFPAFIDLGVSANLYLIFYEAVPPAVHISPSAAVSLKF